MDWLRCNECYILMAKRSRNFVMTQCGHIFCDLCLLKNPLKCRVCGTAEFRSLPLGWPPKLETVMNYFSPVTDFTQLAKKATQFHEDQLMICLRGFKELKKKYEHGKRAFAELMKEFKEKTLRNKKLWETIEEVKASIRMHEQRSLAEHRQGLRENADSRVTCEKSQQPRQQYAARRGQISSSVRRSAGATYVNVPAGAIGFQPTNPTGPSTMRSASASTPQLLPKYPYRPHPAFTDASRVADSGCETAMDDGTPTSTDQGNFAVPSTRRVPKSVASVRRKARSLPRLSDLKAANRNH